MGPFVYHIGHIAFCVTLSRYFVHRYILYNIKIKHIILVRTTLVLYEPSKWFQLARVGIIYICLFDLSDCEQTVGV